LFLLNLSEKDVRGDMNERGDNEKNKGMPNGDIGKEPLDAGKMQDIKELTYQETKNQCTTMKSS